MKTAIAHLTSASPYSQGRYHDIPEERGEAPLAYEERTWRGRLHVDENGRVFIPPMAFKNALSEAARFLAMKIEGKRGATYTKHIEAGVLVAEGVTLPYGAEDIQGEWLFVPSNGQRGGSLRVKRCFPKIPRWSGPVTFYVLDDEITERAFRAHVEAAGRFIGIGRFRPRNNGYYGRFALERLEWRDGEA